MGLRHKIWREELYQKLKDYPGPIKTSDIRKKLGCGMSIDYAMKKIMEEHKDVIKFSYGRDVYYRVIPFGKKDEEKPLTPSEQKKKEWEGQNRLYEIAKSYGLVDFDRFRIGKGQEMAKFIELTDYHSGQKMLANIDHIIAIQEPTYAFNGDGRDGCMVYLSDFDSAIRDKRSYDKLVAALIVAGLEL